MTGGNAGGCAEVNSPLVAIRRAQFSTESRATWTQVTDFVGPVIAGALLGYAARAEIAWLIWIGLVPLLLAIRTGAGYLTIGVGSYFGGLLFSLGALDWLRTINQDDGSGVQNAHEWFVLSQLCAVTWPMSSVAARWLWVHRRISPGFGLCLAWIVSDFARTIVSGMSLDGTAFPYLHLSQLPGIPLVLLQVGDLGGMYAITACIVGANAIVAWGLMTMISARQRGSRGLPWVERWEVRRAGLVAAGVLAVTVYGAFRLWQSPSELGPEITAMPSATRWDITPASHDTFIAASDSLINEKRRLVVWPECAYPSSLFGHAGGPDATGMLPDASDSAGSRYTESIRSVHETNLSQIRRWSEALHAALVVGCVRQAFHDGGWRQFNSALVLAPGDDRPRYYDKIALVPGSEGAPRLGAWLGYDSLPSYERGKRFPIFSVGTSPESSYRFGVAICYDVCFPENFRGYFSQGDSSPPPDFFVMPGSETLDQTGRLKRLLLRIARLRAIETRRPIVRCIHDGYSCLIDGSGRTLALAHDLTLSVPFQMGPVPSDDRMSIYSQCGDWLPKAVLGLLVASVAWRSRRV